MNEPQKTFDYSELSETKEESKSDAPVQEPKDDQKALVPAVTLTAVQVYQGGGDQSLEDILSDIKSRVDNFKPDITTKKGREEIASFAYQISRTKTGLDEMGKELTEDWRQKTNSVNTSRKKMRDTLDALRDQVRKPLTDYEQKEQLRLDNLSSSIKKLESYKECIYGDDQTGALNSHQIAEKLVDFRNFYKETNWQELQERADETFQNISRSLKVAHDARVNYEAEQAELERLRNEQKEREQKQRDEKLKQEAAEKARKEELEQQAKEKADRLQKCLDKIRDYARFTGNILPEPSVIQERQRSFDEFYSSEDWAEFKDQAEQAKDFVHQQLSDLLQRSEQEKVRREEEAEKKRAQEIADAKEAERKRAQKVIDDAAAEEEKRRADLSHRKKIDDDIYMDCEAAISLNKNIPPHVAIINAIKEGKIRHVSIKY